MSAVIAQAAADAGAGAGAGAAGAGALGARAVIPTIALPTCPPVPTFTFTHGFIVGQLSIVVLGLVLIRFLVFEDTRAQALQRRSPFLNTAGTTAAASARKQQSKAAAAAGAAGGAGRRGGGGAAVGGGGGGPGSSSTGAYAALWAAILDRTNYDISTHPSESTDWINVLFAQAIAGYREDAMAGGASMISKTLAPASSSSRSAAKIWQERGMVAAAAAAIIGPSAPEAGSAPDEEAAEGRQERNARDLVQEALNHRISKTTIDWLDPIHVIDVDFGDQFPNFSSARVRPADDTGRMRIELDVDYNDQLSLSIETKLVVNFPRPRFAVLPISLSLTVVKFSGTLALELFSTVPSVILPSESKQQASTSEAGINSQPGGIGSIPAPTSTSSASHQPHLSSSAAPPPPKPKCRHHLHISLQPDFVLEAHASSLIGSRAKLQDIPKIEQLLVARLRAFVHDRFVWPRFWAVGLPNLVPGPSLGVPAAAPPPGGATGGAGPAAGAAPVPPTPVDGLGAAAGSPVVGMPGMLGGANGPNGLSSALPNGSLYGRGESSSAGLRRPVGGGLGSHQYHHHPHHHSATGMNGPGGSGVPEMTLGRGTEATTTNGPVQYR
ncbi:hypothetical protein V8E36_005845 [Tilletia maclaganii]